MTRSESESQSDDSSSFDEVSSGDRSMRRSHTDNRHERINGDVYLTRTKLKLIKKRGNAHWLNRIRLPFEGSAEESVKLLAVYYKSECPK